MVELTLDSGVDSQKGGVPPLLPSAFMRYTEPESFPVRKKPSFIPERLLPLRKPSLSNEL